MLGSFVDSDPGYILVQLNPPHQLYTTDKTIMKTISITNNQKLVGTSRLRLTAYCCQQSIKNRGVLGSMQSVVSIT